MAIRAEVMNIKASGVRWLENAPDSVWWYHRVLLVLSIVSSIMALHSTSQNGLNITPDAVNYIAAARSVVNGSGLLRFNANPIVQWGPLYPLYLAVLDVINRVLPLDFMEIIRFGNCILFGGAVYFSGQLFFRYLRLHSFALLALFWVIFSESIVRLMTFALSEPPFYLLTVLTVLYWPRVLQPDARLRHHVVFGVLVALVPLLRFPGYSLIPMVMLSIVLFQHTIPLVRRFKVALVYSLAGLPLALWLFYGQTTSAYRRLRGNPIVITGENLSRAPRLIADWFLPSEQIAMLIQLLIVVVVVIAVVWPLWRYYRVYRTTGVHQDLRTYSVLIAYYVLFFFIGMMAAFISSRQRLDARHISVLYIFVMLLIFYMAEQILLNARSKRLVVAVLLVTGVGVVHPLTQTYAFISWSAEYCCRGDENREDDLLRWLQQNQLGPGRYYSNTPVPVMYTDLTVFSIPLALENWDRLLTFGDDIYLIWFKAEDPADLYHGPERHYYPLEYDPWQLADVAEITVVADVSRGQILRFRPRTPG